MALDQDLLWFLEFFEAHFGTSLPEPVVAGLARLNNSWQKLFGDCGTSILLYVLTRGMDREDPRSVETLIRSLETIDVAEIANMVSCPSSTRKRDKQVRLAGEAVLARLSGDYRPVAEIIESFAGGL